MASEPRLCKLCGKEIGQGSLFASIVVAIEGEKIKARWDFCTSCILDKAGVIIAKSGSRMIPELLGHLLGGGK